MKNIGIGKVFTNRIDYGHNKGYGYVQGLDYVKNRNIGVGKFPSTSTQSDGSEGAVYIDGELRYVVNELYAETLPEPAAMTLRFEFSQATSDPTTLGTVGTWTKLVAGNRNIWDWTYNNSNWASAFRDKLTSSFDPKIEIIDAGDTSQVRDLSIMLYGCSGITHISLFNTSNVTNMYAMFYFCSSLTSVPSFDTSNVTDMGNMFIGCSSLKSISNYDIHKVSNMQNMFSNCTKVESGALSLYNKAKDTGLVTNHQNTFTNCGTASESGLAELKQIPQNWGGLKEGVTIQGYVYDTTVIGDQEWTRENLFADLNNLSLTNIDWTNKYDYKNKYYDWTGNVGDVTTVTISDTSFVDCISFPVSGGEILNVQINNSKTPTMLVVDSNNTILYKNNGSFSTMLYNVPTNAARVYLNYEHNKDHKCIQSAHTYTQGTWEGYYNNDVTYKDKGYGKLYSIDTVVSDNEIMSDALKASIPAGWRLPTRADFDKLRIIIENNTSTIKSKYDWAGSLVRTDSNNFTALPAGDYYASGFHDIGYGTYLISSTQNIELTNRFYTELISYADNRLTQSTQAKTSAFSVRLVRDV